MISSGFRRSILLPLLMYGHLALSLRADEPPARPGPLVDVGLTWDLFEPGNETDKVTILAKNTMTTSFDPGGRLRGVISLRCGEGAESSYYRVLFDATRAGTIHFDVYDLSAALVSGPGGQSQPCFRSTQTFNELFGRTFTIFAKEPAPVRKLRFVVTERGGG